MDKDKKTIGITIRFWTNGLPSRVGGKNELIPFWTSGNVHLQANPSKGIKPQDVLFHYIDDIPRAIQEVMKRGRLAPISNVGYTMSAQKRRRKE